MSMFGFAGTILGGLLGKNASEDAADAQMYATKQAIEAQERQYNQSREDLAPWREAGTNALAKLQTLMGTDGGPGGMLTPFSAEGMTEDPGYQFGLSEGNKAIERNMKARGMYNSGAALKGLQRFNQDYAGTKFNEAFNRDQINKNQIYNMLAGVSGSGQTSAGQVASMGMQSANNIGNYMLQGGNAKASGIVGGANAMIGALDDVSSHYRMLDLLKGM